MQKSPPKSCSHSHRAKCVTSSLPDWHQLTDTALSPGQCPSSTRPCPRSPSTRPLIGQQATSRPLIGNTRGLSQDTSTQDTTKSCPHQSLRTLWRRISPKKCQREKLLEPTNMDEALTLNPPHTLTKRYSDIRCSRIQFKPLDFTACIMRGVISPGTRGQ